MRPAQETIAPDVWIVREQACFTLEAAPNRASETDPSNATVRRSQSDSQLLFISQKRKGISLCQRNSTLETLRIKLRIRISSNYLVRPARLNQQALLKIATPANRKASRLSKCLLSQKLHQRLTSSTARK